MHVCLYATENLTAAAHRDPPAEGVHHGPVVDLTLLIPVAGLATDAAHRQVAERYAPHELLTCDLWQLTQRLCELPPATINLTGTRSGDPLSLCVIADYETILSDCTARWDECETIGFGTCWKTPRAFFWGVEDRDSPVNPLYLFGRSQDPTLQRIRHSIKKRLHRRLWLTPLRFVGRPVWIGQISCDIGVRSTTQTWNLTTHRIDPNVDESRDYLAKDLLRAQRIKAVGYVAGAPACTLEAPRTNLTGDPYFTDGKRTVIVLSKSRTQPRYVAWS